MRPVIAPASRSGIVDEIDGGDPDDGERAAALLDPGAETMEVMPVASRGHRRQILALEALSEVAEQRVGQQRPVDPY